jgi:hypothetical protein
MNQGTQRADYVPAGPIARAIQEWFSELDLAEPSQGTTLSKDQRYFSPYTILIERTGLCKDSVYRHSQNGRYKYMTFDVADRFLCATDRFNWWWDDPELSKVYERACKGADKIYPLQVAA